MLRACLYSAAALVILVGGLTAGDEKDKKDKADKNPTKATITKVDAAKNTITLQTKDKEGKTTEKTFEIKGDIKLYDEAGKVVTIEAYRVGGGVLVIEREGRIMELRKERGKSDTKKEESKKDKNK